MGGSVAIPEVPKPTVRTACGDVAELQRDSGRRIGISCRRCRTGHVDGLAGGIAATSIGRDQANRIGADTGISMRWAGGCTGVAIAEVPEERSTALRLIGEVQGGCRAGIVKCSSNWNQY